MGTAGNADGQLCRTCTGESTGIARSAHGHRELTTAIGMGKVLHLISEEGFSIGFNDVTIFRMTY